MNKKINATSRKKFISWTAITVASIAFLDFFTRDKKEKSETVTLLSEDGKLVVIDKKRYASTSRKVTNDELKNWIKK